MVERDIIVAGLPCGYEYEFISSVFEEYHCHICHLPLREPVLTRCGHRYCKKCLDEAIKRQHVPQCPVDREPLDREKDIFPDKATERNILSCHVKCPSEGCDWTGEVRHVEAHLLSCHCKIIRCPNHRCQAIMEKRLVEDHVMNTCQWRTLQCGHCSGKYAKCEEEKHSSECRRIPVDCPNGCGEFIPREEVTSHKEVNCPQSLVNCQYDYMGCSIKVKRCEINDHLEQSLRSHFELSVDKVGRVQDECKILRQEFEKMKVEHQGINHKVSSLEKYLSELKQKHRDMETFSPYTWKVTDFWERVRRARNGIEVRIESDVFYVGPQGYKMKLAMYPNGTKEAKNAHISLYIALMKGHYDAILPWPFHYKVTLTVIDQNPDLTQRQNFVKSFVPDPSWKSMQRPASAENERRGFGRFFSHEKLIAGSYVIDETLFIKFEVSPSDKRA